MKYKLSFTEEIFFGVNRRYKFHVAKYKNIHSRAFHEILHEPLVECSRILCTAKVEPGIEFNVLLS